MRFSYVLCVALLTISALSSYDDHREKKEMKKIWSEAEKLEMRGQIWLEYTNDSQRLEQLFRKMENEFCRNYGTKKQCIVTQIADNYDDYYTRKQHLTYKIYANKFCETMVGRTGNQRPCECHNLRWSLWDNFAQFDYNDYKDRVDMYKNSLSPEQKKHENMENKFCVGGMFSKSGYYDQKSCTAVYHKKPNEFKEKYDEETCHRFCKKVKEEEYHENAFCEVINREEEKRRQKMNQMICMFIAFLMAAIGGGILLTNPNFLN